MKRSFFVFFLVCSIPFLTACSTRENPRSEADATPALTDEQQKCEAFNACDYGFVLSFSDGLYSLKPDNYISKEEIKAALEGKTMRLGDEQYITIDGVCEDYLVGGGGVYMTFSDHTLHYVGYPCDPNEPANECEMNFSVDDNEIRIDFTYVVYSIKSGELEYYRKHNGSSNLWISGRFVLHESQPE